MIRVENWDVALFHWGEERVGQDFRWGQTDCAALVIEAVQIMYGKNVLPKVPRWKSLRKAVKVYNQILSLADFFHEAGAVPVPDGYAQTGDLVCSPGLDSDALPRLGVVVNGRVIGSRRTHGVESFPLWALEDGAEIWRLPNG